MTLPRTRPEEARPLSVACFSARQDRDILSETGGWQFFFSLPLDSVDQDRRRRIGACSSRADEPGSLGSPGCPTPGPNFKKKKHLLHSGAKRPLDAAPGRLPPGGEPGSQRWQALNPGLGPRGRLGSTPPQGFFAGSPQPPALARPPCPGLAEEPPRRAGMGASGESHSPGAEQGSGMEMLGSVRRGWPLLDAQTPNDMVLLVGQAVAEVPYPDCATSSEEAEYCNFKFTPYSYQSTEKQGLPPIRRLPLFCRRPSPVLSPPPPSANVAEGQTSQTIRISPTRP